MELKIAIQGIKGSNHHQVAKDFFGEDIELLECSSFDAVVDSLIIGAADKGIMAIENSIAGSIIPNYNLVYHNDIHVIGEHYLNIHHNLMVLKGRTFDDIQEVHSHPMALLQCKEFFKAHPQIKLVESADTAETAKRIQKEELEHIAAIAPKMAAELYDLEIIADNIQTIVNNSTRFIILKKQNKVLPEEEINKASLRFITDHKRGSLATVLNVMSDCNMNLTKIQSLPVIETPWKYAFFVDVTFDKYKHFAKTKSLMQIMAEDFKVLGEYKNALL
ncbi:MAG TPA: prephenate dehydratase [Muricauda sp.]|uniref:prephenate dehydratase n=1 Tax=Flagellimonas aurea TaxID=2915619 RepID=A0ABS3G591_9FLAO|nr:prephenate dehydratase [Allomuricauda aurea]MAO17020.1 prephenate dehydratase [Allomuricauda sp.]MBC70882.1 prephenate dehydratase [Allomuricauda sp.]MBO0354535.1 prephenate dehydratase [Allomuricauda aurea]HBU78757.1 prephenate dehydratase [Allomuricauda sp.]|tara:strand:- start:1296 stop:2123 length:828 start_codon:yes stop_codon:yes gene_type:complete